MGVKDNYIYEESMKELDATFKKELEECEEECYGRGYEETATAR